MTTTKPHEFWIVECKGLKLFQYDKDAKENLERQKIIWREEAGHIIHVIEHSAYQAALDEIDSLKAKVARYEKVLTERCCIDDCGFDVENETIEVLRDCMKAIDFEARQALGGG